MSLTHKPTSSNKKSLENSVLEKFHVLDYFQIVLWHFCYKQVRFSNEST